MYISGKRQDTEDASSGPKASLLLGDAIQSVYALRSVHVARASCCNAAPILRAFLTTVLYWSTAARAATTFVYRPVSAASET